MSENYTEALIHNGDYFFCRMDKCIDPFGNNYGDGWQYFSSIVRNIGIYEPEAAISDFARFIEITHYDTAFDGFPLQLKNSEGLKKYSSSCLPFLVPWSPADLSHLEERVLGINMNEELVIKSGKRGRNPLDNPLYLAENHYYRLVKLRHSILQEGFDFFKDPYDPVQGYILEREQDYRLLVFSGQHRVAVLSGLKHETIPVKFVNKFIVRVENIDSWPLVRIGLWDQEDAMNYFNYLFDFDSKSWAAKNGLIV